MTHRTGTVAVIDERLGAQIHTYTSVVQLGNSSLTRVTFCIFFTLKCNIVYNITFQQPILCVLLDSSIYKDLIFYILNVCIPVNIHNKTKPAYSIGIFLWGAKLGGLFKML